MLAEKQCGSRWSQLLSAAAGSYLSFLSFLIIISGCEKSTRHPPALYWQLVASAVLIRELKKETEC